MAAGITGRSTSTSKRMNIINYDHLSHLLPIPTITATLSSKFVLGKSGNTFPAGRQIGADSGSLRKNYELKKSK